MLQRRFASQYIIISGLLLTAAGFMSLAAATEAGERTGMIIFGLGSGIVMTIGANTVMSAAPENRTADAGAIQESAFALGAGTGIAVFGILAIHHGRTPTIAGPSAEAIYGAGTETALGIAALFYAFFALAAGLHLLSTTRDRHLT